ncbi:hypothetical protein D3C78_1226180 [compost metagenome]
MRGKRHQVDRPLGQVNRHFARTLRRIDMEQRTVLAHPLANSRDVVDGAQFVVDQHQRHQEGIVAQRFADRLSGDQAFGIRQQVGDFNAGILQLPCSVEDRFVLDLAGNDVPTGLSPGLGHALEGEIVRFGGAGGPDDLLRLRPHQIGNLLAGLLDRAAGLLAKRVGAGRRVAEVTTEPQTVDHHLDDPLIHRRGGGVIKIQRTLIHKRLAELVPGSGTWAHCRATLRVARE